MNLSAANSTAKSRGSNQNIQVYARVRPINSRERCMRSAEVVDVVSPREIEARHTVDSKLSKKFTFDRSFGPESKQCEVYNTVVAPLIEEVLSGYNCTVFAYGQTGTGKTHTMVGTETAELKSSWEDDSEIGIIPRALSHLFDELRLMEMEYSMRISYLELYNEELCDLLSSDDSIKIRIFDDSTKKGSVIIQGLEEIPVHSKDDVYKLLEKGKERRKTATTLMNAQSSRSHTVFSILVHIRENGIDGEEMLKIGKLNLVDLAGSENVSKAGNEKGIRVRETVNINQSLLTLGRVITALVERTPHIPYRESKLTRLLQESLGGRTKTSIIATISPGHKDIEETLSTLEYAHRAKNIQNKPEVNQKLTKKTVLKEYTEEIDKLKRDLMAARDKNGIYLAEETYNEITLKMDSQNRELNEKMLLLKALKDELQNKEKIFNEVSLNLVEKTEELKRTEKNLTTTQGALRETKKILNTTKRRYKEKKVLLESHIKTENELTNQAHKILEVADTATDETKKLHNTIERRKDVDMKIQTACERFSNQMMENYELMNGNLSHLQNQHRNCASILMDEFSNTHKVHNQLLKNANQNIQNVNDLCTKSLTDRIQLSEKFNNLLATQSQENKANFKKLFNTFQNNEIEYQRIVQANLKDLEINNHMQKQNINKMHENITQILAENLKELDKNTNSIEEKLLESMHTINNNNIEMNKIKNEIDNERSLALEQETAMNEFIQRMQVIKEKRTTCIDTIANSNENVVKSNQKSCIQLEEGINLALKYKQKRHVDIEAEQNALKKQAIECILNLDNNIEKCTTLKTQIIESSNDNKKQMNEFVVEADKQYNDLNENIKTFELMVKENCTQDKEIIRNAIEIIDKNIQTDVKQLTSSITVQREYLLSLENQLDEYHRVYAEQMRNCNNDVINFKNSELQTYKATGSTPSKRDYSYPRVLTSTSPHNIIIKRVRQENDWSDLDTTATIEELSENEMVAKGKEEEEEEEEEEIEINQTRQDITDSEILLNSTPIDVTNVTQRRGCGNHSIGNTLKLTQQQNLTGSFTKARTAQLNVSPRSNKENIS